MCAWMIDGKTSEDASRDESKKIIENYLSTYIFMYNELKILE